MGQLARMQTLPLPLIDRSIDWLIDRLIVWLTDGLIDVTQWRSESDQRKGWNLPPDTFERDQCWCIKIQAKRINLSTRLGNKYRICGLHSPEPRAEVYCFGWIFIYWNSALIVRFNHVSFLCLFLMCCFRIFGSRMVITATNNELRLNAKRISLLYHPLVIHTLTWKKLFP